MIAEFAVFCRPAGKKSWKLDVPHLKDFKLLNTRQIFVARREPSKERHCAPKSGMGEVTIHPAEDVQMWPSYILY